MLEKNKMEKTRIAILLSDRIEFKANTIIKDKE